MKTYYYATIEKNGKTSATRNYKKLGKLANKLVKKLRDGYEIVDIYEINRKLGSYSATTL